MAIIGLRKVLKSNGATGFVLSGQPRNTSSPNTISAGIALPYPPSVNTYYRTVGGRILVSRKGREYRETIARHLAARGFRPLKSKLAVYIDVYPPDRRKRDLGNLDKALMDACQGYLFVDDGQIDLLHIERHRVEPGGKVVVRVEER